MFRLALKQSVKVIPQFRQVPKSFVSRGFAAAATFTPLTTEETNIIKATVPILQVGGETLIKHFYETMLRDHPEVVPYFNKAHQASGDQPRALANAVLMYAKNIESLGNLGPLVGQIVNKHVSLNIERDHYSVVGSCLLAAIREVLGPETATEAVIGAWAAAYGQLAAILINAEQTVYDSKASAEGGWRGEREFVVKDKVRESSEITSFHLYPKDGKAILPYEAGQYIGLHLNVDGDEVRRNYSLSCASNGKYYRISVKREPNGKVSNHLHDSVPVGGSLFLYPPAGDFTLKGLQPATEATKKPIFFVSGGVGITPCIAMLEEALRNEATAQKDIYFIHAAKSEEVHAFHPHLSSLAEKHKNVKYIPEYSACPESTGKKVLGRLTEFMPAEKQVDAYFLGPLGFMVGVKKGLVGLGVDQSNLHWEFFGPNKNLE